MDLKELLKSEANINVTVSLYDLRQLFREIAQEVAASSGRMTVEPESDLCSRKEALKLLNIDSSTLWKWEKCGYVKSYPFGGRKRYNKAEITAISTGAKVTKRKE